MAGPTKAEAIQALRDAAFVETLHEDFEGEPREPRTLIHTFAHSGGMALGADWDLRLALEFVERADSLAWVDHPLGHDLEVRGDGRLVYFAAKRGR